MESKKKNGPEWIKVRKLKIKNNIKSIYKVDCESTEPAFFLLHQSRCGVEKKKLS